MRVFRRLAWLDLKSRPKAVPLPRKNRLNYREEHAEALIEDASRTFAKEVDKALAPEPAPAEAAA